MIDLKREGEVFVLTMNDGENRWNTTFVRAFDAALNEVEAVTGAAALVTASATEKFFSNGLDLAWLSAAGDQGNKRAFGQEFMALMGRIITFPMPTIAAVNGHGFGAGFMSALCHDIRFMRADRGFLCANEVEIGLLIPDAELALFRHKLSMNVFFETVQLARRWAGPAALEAGVVQQLEPLENLLDAAISRAGELAHLGADRAVYGKMKQAIYGENASINSPHGAAHLLRHPDLAHQSPAAVKAD